ncbi:hypothetical protein GGR52DRAFT_567447 [Hypoxylon sp. FL1284]|nr:hypothetical protein GGR52DRAFT_567447 [Hypoxylon sp. FL1284]
MIIKETLQNHHPPLSYYTSYVKRHIEQYVRNILAHESLAWMRDLVPILRAFNMLLARRADELNDTRYVLMQRDLHFGKIMCDPITARITAILDWEFAAVLPLPMWTPGNAFLWNGQQTAEGLSEQKHLYGVFEQMCGRRDGALLEDFSSKAPHDTIKGVFNYVRAIVEVCPRGQKAEGAREWRRFAEEALGTLGITI